MLPVSKTLKPVARTARRPRARCRRRCDAASAVIGSIGVGLERDVVAVERRQVVVGEARPLAAQRVARRELVAHDRVVDLLAQVRAADPLAGVGEREHAVEVRRRAGRSARRRSGWPAADSRLAPGSAAARAGRPRERRVELGQAPDRRALEDGEVLDLGRDRRDHLDGGGAGADHRDALAAQVDVVVPARGVHHRAGEVSRPGMSGGLGWVSTPVAPTTKRAVIVVAVGGVEAPRVRVVVEGRAGDAVFEPDPPAHAVLVHAVLGVGLAARRPARRRATSRSRCSKENW